MSPQSSDPRPVRAACIAEWWRNPTGLTRWILSATLLVGFVVVPTTSSAQAPATPTNDPGPQRSEPSLTNPPSSEASPSAPSPAAPSPAEAPALGSRQGLPVVAWQDAKTIAGRRGIVFGEVVDVGGTNNIQFINFSQTDRAAFKGVIHARDLSKFPVPLAEPYLRHKVEIEGFVSLYNGNPQIVISDPKQVRVVTEFPPSFLPEFKRVAVGDEIVVATCNALNLFDAEDDPYTNDDSTPQKPKQELEALARMLRGINADVVAMQEVESRGYLQRFLDVYLPDLGYEHVVFYEGNDLRGIDVCLISRVPVGKVISHRHLRFPSHTPGKEWERFQRDLLRVELRPTHGDPFEIWVVHLKSNAGGTEEAEPIRLSEAEELRRLVVERLTADPGAAFLICGDFNDVWESPTLKSIVGDMSMSLRAFFEEAPADQRITYNQEPFRTMIDFQLCSPAMADRFVAGSYAIVAGSPELTGSDHNPVVSRYRAMGRQPGASKGAGDTERSADAAQSGTTARTSNPASDQATTVAESENRLAEVDGREAAATQETSPAIAKGPAAAPSATPVGLNRWRITLVALALGLFGGMMLRMRTWSR